MSPSRVLLTSMILTAALPSPAANTVRLFDFSGSDQGWTAVRTSQLKATPEGLSFTADDFDPWIEGPPAPDMPLGSRVRLRVRLKSSKSGGAQVFFGPHFNGENVIGLPIAKKGEWLDAEAILPPQQPGARLRIDPPEGAACTIAWIDAQALVPLLDTGFPPPKAPAAPPADAPAVVAGDIAIVQRPSTWSSFQVRVKGTPMAEAHAAERIGVLLGGKPAWIETAAAKPACRTLPNRALETAVALRDPDGAKWRLIRRFSPSPDGTSIAIETEFCTDRDREVFHLPWITLFPGLGTFGERKMQALLPGVEYLENEPSSSEAEIEGIQADRRIVDDFRLCYPMMTLVGAGRYIAVAWDRRDHPAPVFDSPDRVFRSGAHLLGLWEPPVGRCRIEHDIHVYDTFRLERDKPRRLKLTLFGGEGATVVPAIQHYVRLRGLPETPRFPGGFDEAIRLLAMGWTRSECRNDGLFRHAVWGNHFPPQPAADAPAFMQWIATQAADSALAASLGAAATEALARLPQNSVFAEGVSHVRRPVPPLLFGKLPEYIDHRLAAARLAAGGFNKDGILRYRPAKDKADFGRTHYSDHANGLAAAALEGILEAAALSGDDGLARRSLELLDQQTKLYSGTVPRGAQTWEMPLHTPDILASAHLVRCYTLGYLLSGEPRYLDEARYWAWTGLAMVYLDPPFEKPVGVCATIGVIGATHWRAPNWIGQPVQWCGLVYRSALLDLADADTQNAALWHDVANGITIAGMQMTFPLDDEKRCGLLPDFFLLRDQISEGPAINPGTVGAGLPEAFGKGRFYATSRLPGGTIAHAPGAITRARTEGGALRFCVDGWPANPYRVLIAPVPAAPAAVAWTGDPDRFAFHHDPHRRILILTVRGKGEIRLTSGGGS